MGTLVHQCFCCHFDGDILTSPAPGKRVVFACYSLAMTGPLVLKRFSELTAQNMLISQIRAGCVVFFLAILIDDLLRRSPDIEFQPVHKKISLRGDSSAIIADDMVRTKASHVLQIIDGCVRFQPQKMNVSGSESVILTCTHIFFGLV